MTQWAPPPVVNIQDLVPNPETLSPRRRKVLFEILPKVLGATYKHGSGGNAKWSALSAGYDPTTELARDKAAGKPGDHTTSCGALPGLVANELGLAANIVREGMGGKGLNSVRAAAIRQGAWIQNSGLIQMLAASSGLTGLRPLPGDIYGLCATHDPNSILVHVGIIVRPGTTPNDPIWWTADAGQGTWPDQACILVQRNYEVASAMLTGESTTGLVRNKKMLAGWVDIDKYPFKT
jgi:hypothetical protein